MDTLPPELMSVLCHPKNHSRLQQDGSRLVPQMGSQVFPIRQGIPHLLHAPPLRHRVWAWLYNRIAFGYDLGVRWGWQLALGGAPIDRQSYIPEIVVSPGQRVLETAIGTGANIPLLPESGHYFGVDISHNMLKRCRRNLDRQQREAYLVQADMQALPFMNDSFDVVFHMGGLQFASDPRRVLEEMFRTARPGSAIILVDESYSLPRILRTDRRTDPEIAARGLESLLQLVPSSVHDKKAQPINQGELFLLKFRKPTTELR